MAENEQKKVEFHYTLVPSLLEIVRENLSKDSPLLGKLVTAIEHHAREKGVIVCVEFSDDLEGRKELEVFKKVSQLLEKRAKEFFEFYR